MHRRHEDSRYELAPSYVRENEYPEGGSGPDAKVRINPSLLSLRSIAD